MAADRCSRRVPRRGQGAGRRASSSPPIISPRSVPPSPSPRCRPGLHVEVNATPLRWPEGPGGGVQVHQQSPGWRACSLAVAGLLQTYCSDTGIVNSHVPLLAAAGRTKKPVFFEKTGFWPSAACQTSRRGRRLQRSHANSGYPCAVNWRHRSVRVPYRKCEVL